MKKLLILVFSIVSLVSCEETKEKVLVSTDKELMRRIDSLQRLDSMEQMEQALLNKIDGYEADEFKIDGYTYYPYYFKLANMNYVVFHRNGEIYSTINISLDSARYEYYTR
jgi:hypothetical protein